MHHIKDSHDFHILDWNGYPVSVPLPVILWTNEGLVAFMSSEFHHDDSGATVVKRKTKHLLNFMKKYIMPVMIKKVNIFSLILQSSN